MDAVEAEGAGSEAVDAVGLEVEGREEVRGGRGAEMRVSARLENEGGEDGALTVWSDAAVVAEGERAAGGLVPDQSSSKFAIVEGSIEAGDIAHITAGDAEPVEFAANEFLARFDLIQRRGLAGKGFPVLKVR